MARDPGKTLRTASVFPIRETSKTVRQSLSSQDQVDIWKLNSSVRSSLNLNLNQIAKEANVDVALLNSAGRVVKASKKRGNRAEVFNDLPLEVGTYYVQVKLQPGSAKTRYALTMAATPVSDQLGNSFETASPIRSITATITDFVGNSDPDDFLSLRPLIAGQFNLSLTGLSDDANLELYDANRNLITASNNPDAINESINQRLTNIAGSVYYVRVAPAPGRDVNYTLSYSFTADTPVKTASGLQYIDLATGTGANPTTGQTVTVQYTGILVDGTVFDSSRERNRPFSFQIGQGDVIQGWDEGISTMRVGSRRQLIIPPGLAYGSQGVPGVIPGNATLIFDVEVIGIS